MTAGTVEPRLATHQVTLVDLVDRLLGKGVVAAGDVTLSAADIDLVHVNLRALIASAGTIASGIVVPVGNGRQAPPVPVSRGRSDESPRTAPPPRPALPPARRRSSSDETRIDADPEKLERGLAQLVLTLVELLRDLMERQALRRIDDGTLSDEEIDRLGETFMLLDQRMGELKDVFGLTDEDLNLDLGPLGNLL
jgi:hypothetical protein